MSRKWLSISKVFFWISLISSAIGFLVLGIQICNYHAGFLNLGQPFGVCVCIFGPVLALGVHSLWGALLYGIDKTEENYCMINKIYEELGNMPPNK